MSKHTPGPWHVAGGVQIRSNRHQIAKVWMMRNGEGSANAGLISATPDLLDALQLAVHLYERYGLVSGCVIDGVSAGHWVNKARDAIAKATGDQS